MPWLETSSMEEREQFITDDRRGLYTRAELCARYGISRKTGYKWLARYEADGRRGLRPVTRRSTRDAKDVVEMAVLTQTAMRVLSQVTRCQGFNIGMNQGRIAGAGIADHLHQHIVPRWSLDSNFFPIIAKTKALPILLEDMRRDIQAAWPV